MQAEHDGRPSAAIRRLSQLLFGGLGVASACSADAAQITICLFSLTPSLLVLKGDYRKTNLIYLVGPRQTTHRPRIKEIKEHRKSQTRLQIFAVSPFWD